MEFTKFADTINEASNLAALLRTIKGFVGDLQKADSKEIKLTLLRGIQQATLDAIDQVTKESEVT